MVKALKDFLWYKAGDDIKEEDLVYVDSWKKDKLVSDERLIVSSPKNKEEPEEEEESLIDKVKDVVEDVMDDGKLNQSNNKKSGRGRPKKK